MWKIPQYSVITVLYNFDSSSSSSVFCTLRPGNAMALPKLFVNVQIIILTDL